MTSYYESYIGTSESERNEMIQELGFEKIEDLFSDIPSNLILDDLLDIPGPYSEQELGRLFAKIASKNLDPKQTVALLGGGIRQQYIPAAIEELMRRGELYTSYTPYQPEISQGLLQLIYEYQSMVAELLEMDVVNASMYDWGSALGEALLIMHRITHRKILIIAEPISPQRLAVARVYVQNQEIDLEIIPHNNGKVDINRLIEIFEKEITKPKKEQMYAGIYFEVPSFYGTLSDYPGKLIELIHQSNSLVTVGIDAISLGILASPGEYDADIVVGEGQILGNSISSGGPLLGILATKYNRKWIKEVPGRLIGATTEIDSDVPAYCITLQTREQHIRREKAASNICTNQSITAVNAAIYLAMLGKDGIQELAQSLTDKAHYLGEELGKLDNVSSPLYEPYFSEFLIKIDRISHEDLDKKCLEKSIIAGIKVEGKGTIRLISVSEIQSKRDLDQFILMLKEVVS